MLLVALLILPRGRRSAGVAFHLACDLARSGSKTYHLCSVRHTAFNGFTAATRQIASKLAPTPSGQKLG
jgi:hypothetical protein